MENINLRVVALMDKMGFKKGELANKLGISAAVITHIYSGRNKAGLDLIQKLLNEFHNINERWLLLGEGDMIKTETGFSTNEIKVKIENTKAKLKLQQHAFYDIEKILDEISKDLSS